MTDSPTWPISRCSVRRSTTQRSLIVAAMVVVVSALPAAAEVDSFRSSGECTHLSSAVTVDAAAASDLVPDDFVLLEPVPGTAVLALVIQDCETAVDDGRRSRGMSNVVFVVLDPVRSPAGCQVYDLFWTTSRNDEWHRSMQRIGIEVGLSPASTLRIEPSMRGVIGRASNPYRPAPHSYSVTAVDSLSPPAPLTSVHCFVGPRGLVRQTYDHQMQVGAGVAEVTLGASPLWEKLGATNATSEALLARFTWTGVIELIERPSTSAWLGEES